jgi:general secretion pathway protein D
VPGSGNIPVQDTKRIEDKLARIILSKVDLKDVTVREAIDYLRQKSREMDTTESDPTKRGVNIVPKLEGSSLPAAPAGGATGGFGEAAAIPGLTDTTAAVPAPDANLAAAVNPNDIRITLNLMSVPLGEVLRYVCQQAGLKIKIDPYAVNIVPLSEPTDTLYTKEYKVQPGFIGKSASAGSTDTAVPGDATRGGTGLAARSGAREFLESNGVTFPPGSAANFLPSSSKLIVRNTQANLELVDALVEADKGNVPSQVEIESKFIEITQNNAKELGFDWMLGQANVPGNQSVFFGGGVQGVAPTINTADWPFVPPGADLPVGQNPITGGNRSGNYAITQNAIDALLFGLAGNSLKGTGVFSLAGVFTDPQFQLVIRALNQKKGVDLLSSPRVTTKSGQPATIEIIREFIYPTEFDPPEIPQNIGGGSSGFGESAAIQTFPVTPTTPTSFETRNTGVTLEVEPVVGPDGYTIDLNLLPQVVEFEGFINYGSPISTVNPAALGVGGAIAQLAGQPSSVVLTDNVINQPIFSTRKVKTSVSIWDGSTVVLGGLMREDVQKVEDKVPLLGDIPLVGRFFRSDVDQHLKRNLVIFVTARLINPAGDPVNGMNDDEEEVDEVPVPDAPPGLPAPEATGFFK